MTTEPSNRLFPIRSHPSYYFYTGHLAHGGQALIVRSWNEKLLIINFDLNGVPSDLVRKELLLPQYGMKLITTSMTWNFRSTFSKSSEFSRA